VAFGSNFDTGAMISFGRKIVCSPGSARPWRCRPNLTPLEIDDRGLRLRPLMPSTARNSVSSWHRLAVAWFDAS